MSLLTPLMASILDSPLAVPAIGLAACGLAFALGWRMIHPRSPQDGDAKLLDADFLSGVTKERRGTPRRKGNTVEVILSLGDKVPERRGWVLDRSQGGLCILVEEPVPERSNIRVRPKANDGQVVWVDVLVRSCRPEGGQFELGCQFHRVPNYNLLLLFG